MQLVNLLNWLPGHSGFGSYVQRVVPGIHGLRLQLAPDGHGALVEPHRWTPHPPPWAPHRRMRLFQRYGLVQHGVDLKALLHRHGFCDDQLEAIYSPFFDALFALPQVPQLITCHDLTPLVASNSRKAWLRYRFWQPRHCRTASRLIAISRYVADQLVDFGVSADQIEVVPNGIHIQRERVCSPGSEDLLALARHDVNKNLPALFRGLSQFQRLRPQWRGVFRIVGRGGRLTPLVQRLQQALPRPQQVQLIESMGQDQLLQCLRNSLALISASTEEGFDYPVLEAKAEGIPTVISDIPVHREFHQDSSLFFPTDDKGIALAVHIDSLLNEPSRWRDLSLAGFSLAEFLSVEAQQNQIMVQLESLAG